MATNWHLITIFYNFLSHVNTLNKFKIPLTFAGGLTFYNISDSTIRYLNNYLHYELNLKIWLLYAPIFLVSSPQKVTGAKKWYNCTDLGNSCADNTWIVFMGLFKRSPSTNICSRSENFHTKNLFNIWT